MTTNSYFKRGAFIALSLILLPVMPLWAADPATTPVAPTTTVAADKSQYTLFNPVPTSQMRDMAIDRPNAANTPQTVDTGHIQIETGIADYSYFQSSAHPFTSWGFGDFNFRLGVLNNLEISAEIEAYDEEIGQINSPTRTSREGSFSDTIVGAKYNFWGNEGSDQPWSTGFAIQPHFKIPTADMDLGDGHFEFNVVFPFAVTLPHGFNLSIQPGFDYLRNANENGYAPSYEQSICLDRVFFKNLDLYAEYAFMVSNDSHTEAEQLIDVGGIYQLRTNIALDTGLQFGLNRSSPNFAATVGVSVRF